MMAWRLVQVRARPAPDMDVRMPLPSVPRSVERAVARQGEFSGEVS